jgi:hypothetical protein
VYNLFGDRAASVLQPLGGDLAALTTLVRVA